MNKLAAVDIEQVFDSSFDTGGNTIGDLVALLVQASFVIAGVLILFLFIFGGFGIIMGAGNDNPEQAAKGKKALTSALIGFFIIFTAYWVIRIIEIIVGVNFVTYL
jgi:hypothetical protein